LPKIIQEIAKIRLIQEFFDRINPMKPAKLRLTPVSLGRHDLMDYFFFDRMLPV